MFLLPLLYHTGNNNTDFIRQNNSNNDCFRFNGSRSCKASAPTIYRGLIDYTDCLSVSQKYIQTNKKWFICKAGEEKEVGLSLRAREQCYY
jgi:hypothetical protein